jgi:hypothetical protein
MVEPEPSAPSPSVKARARAGYGGWVVGGLVAVGLAATALVWLAPSGGDRQALRQTTAPAAGAATAQGSGDVQDQPPPPTEDTPPGTGVAEVSGADPSSTDRDDQPRIRRFPPPDLTALGISSSPDPTTSSDPGSDGEESVAVTASESALGETEAVGTAAPIDDQPEDPEAAGRAGSQCAVTVVGLEDATLSKTLFDEDLIALPGRVPAGSWVLSGAFPGDTVGDKGRYEIGADWKRARFDCADKGAHEQGRCALHRER